MTDNYEEWAADQQVYFDGPCTCEHDEKEHGFAHCDVEGCVCEAHLSDR